MSFPFLLEPLLQLIRRECVLSDLLFLIVARALVRVRLLRPLPGSHGDHVRVDQGQDIIDIGQDRVRLDGAAPSGQIRIQLPGDLPVHVDVVEESAERTPRESAPDVVQRVACPYEQVFFDCLTVLAYEFREAADSPSFSFPSERP